MFTPTKPPNTARPSPRILVVDDETSARTALVELLREEGFLVHSAADAYKALGQLDEWTPDLVITDVKMPGMDGIELMGKVHERLDAVGVVVMTAFGSVENAVEAMQGGADDYLTKPVHFPELLVVVRRVLDHYELRRENARLKTSIAKEAENGSAVEWIGHCKPSRELLELAHQVADSDASVLVVGEAGTGKQLIARALHEWARRSDGPFLTLRCAGLEQRVLEAELFGYCEGGFAGSSGAREGALTRGDGGTLFLDEVDAMPRETQIKLLRFLMEDTFEMLGSSEALTSKVRVVAGSNHELHDDVSQGRFREDLYYRLNVITLRVPTLRERWEDLPELAMHFLKQNSRKHQKVIRGFSDRALRVLMHYEWPDNVRQLERCVERAVVLCQERDIEPKHLPREVMEHSVQPDEMPTIPGCSMADLEKYAILRTLEHVCGSTSKAAELLGISPRKIQYRLAEYREDDPSGVPAVLEEGAAR